MDGTGGEMMVRRVPTAGAIYPATKPHGRTVALGGLGVDLGLAFLTPDAGVGPILVRTQLTGMPQQMPLDK